MQIRLKAKSIVMKLCINLISKSPIFPSPRDYKRFCKFQVLHEELSEKLSKVNEKSSEAELDEAVALVMQARSDNKIWKSGLDISYKTFLANKPSPTMKSVLLSIL